MEITGFNEVLEIATILTPIITSIIQMVKQVIKQEGFDRAKPYVPFVAIIVGIFLGFAIGPFTELSIEYRLWSGGLSGLTATGFYELGKHLKPNKEK